MLRYRYLEPHFRIVGVFDEDKKDYRRITTLSPTFDYAFLLRRAFMLKNIVEVMMKKQMEEDFHREPDDKLNGHTYTECAAFVDALDEFIKYIRENKGVLCTVAKDLDLMLNTQIIVNDKYVMVFSGNPILKDLIKDRVKSYLKLGVFYIDEKSKEARNVRYLENTRENL